MPKTKTAEDYEQELAEARAKLTSQVEHDTSVQSRQLDEALEWVDHNRHDFTPAEADATIDFINGLRNQRFTNSLEWHTKPEG